MAGYELSFSLLLTGTTLVLAGVATFVVLGMTQFLAYRTNSQWAQITSQVLETHLPDSEGPKAVGGWLIFMTLLLTFLLLATPLREEPLWIRLLFTVFMPVSTYIGISLFAVAARRPR
jgi:UDP-N-acetylmuramyl pentapeptide phosphotransferase/UDP-N-acetylglucosamine-1-phosphate transferase